MEEEQSLGNQKELSAEEKRRLAKKLRMIQRVYFSQAQETNPPQSLKKSELIKTSAKANSILRDGKGKILLIFDTSEISTKIHYFSGRTYIQSGRLSAKVPLEIEENFSGYNWIKLVAKNNLPAVDINLELKRFSIEVKPKGETGTSDLLIAVFDPKKPKGDQFETIFEFNQ